MDGYENKLTAADMFKIMQQLKEKFKIGKKVVVKTFKCNTVCGKVTRVEMLGEVIGTYKHHVEVRYPRGTRESFTWAECIAEGYTPI